MTTHEGVSPSISILERYPSLKEIPKDGFPKHVLIIPDGNRRFASGLQEESIFGHKQGVQVLLEILRDLRNFPIEIVTIWGFSADNWKRPEEETTQLLSLINIVIDSHLDELMENNVRFLHLGRKDRVPENLRETLERTETETAQNSQQTLCVAIDFGGDDQTARMIERGIEAGLKHPVSIEEMKKLRDGQGEIPPADLLIRTSGEMRISDIGWLNGPNTEFFPIEENFPEIDTGHIVKAIVDFSKRKRNMGA